jgi:hypothetical protein
VPALAAFIMRGPMGAAAIAGLFGLVGLFVWPAWLFSGSTVSLFTLRRGAAGGLQVIILAALFCAVVSYFGTGSMVAALLFGLVIWLPMWVTALVLRHSAAQGVALAAIGAFAAASILAAWMLVPDIGDWWYRQLGSIQAALASQDANNILARIDVRELATQMTGAVAVYIVLCMTSMMALSRWWQSLLFNVGGFRKEVHALRLPRELDYAVFVLGLAVAVSMLQRLEILWLHELLTVAIALYAIQGLAVVHFHWAARKLARAWLVLVYAAFILMPYAVALIGIVDAVIDTRGVKKSGSGSRGI